jgi:hypothetical protein
MCFTGAFVTLAGLLFYIGGENSPFAKPQNKNGKIKKERQQTID